ncbi:MAG: hypothetical protein VX320_05355 [Candidatus Thermoplasmatota archaeon]|nr:hypothetical protein [Candidatus Thermoplasmatota archaeon]
MTEEEVTESAPAETQPESTPVEEPKVEKPVDINDDAKLRKKLRVEGDEEILLIRRPSLFAFMPIYFVGLLVLLIHLFFDWAEAPDDAEWYEDLFYFLVGASKWAGGAGFAFVMLFFTWLNRLINHPASGKWVTTYLLLVSLTPLFIQFDEFLYKITDLWMEEPVGDFIPFDYNITMFGIVWTGLMWAITFWYQKSFLYAVTTERIIHTQDFIYERDGLRLLHEDIIAVHKQRSPIGALFGYATIYTNIGDQSHVATESVGVSVGVPGTDNKSGGVFGFIRKLFVIITYQRTVKTERFTPDISFYGIRRWEEAYDLINKLQRENSDVAKADAQLDALQNIQEMLANKPDSGDSELDDLDEMLSGL